MVKKITFDCNFSGVSQPVGFYIGDSVESKNPISFQAKWLAEKRGGSVPKNMIDLLEKIKKVSDQQAIPFDMLYKHTFKEIENLKKIKNIKNQEKKEIQDVESKQELIEHEKSFNSSPEDIDSNNYESKNDENNNE